MTVQPQTVNNTRARLLDAARYLFWEKGYAATGMAEILERAQANSGSFYHFFASKEALLLAVLEAYLEGLDPVVIQPAFLRHRDPIKRIFAILEGYRERLLSTECRYGCPLGRLALEIEAENLPAHQLIARNFTAWTTAIRGCLEAARARLPRGTDLDALATLRPQHHGRRRSAIPLPPPDRTLRSIGGPTTQLFRLPAGRRQEKRST